ncbi:hypothetical protein E2562_015328 [Oryza meyeriana var. granulata]|uniref:Expansin-like EG45 domain-containing protein n=1 Tax=Oryza meyeriana var. granulata TaxID=110450 RepID=A0A6G1EJK5_9ORYZ|nr:hypothetical protein E2562_015328 [Oryza meyeriana var. granulata]
MIVAGSPSIYKSCLGCGSCYQVHIRTVYREMHWQQCLLGQPVTLVITDECPEGSCLNEPVHFDLSGTALSAMAKPGQAD